MKRTKVHSSLNAKVIPFVRVLCTLVAALSIGVFVAYASETNGTIVTGGNNGYAWSDQAGWVNFGATNSTIQITDSSITGYAWNSNYGWINMAPTNGGITVAANGALAGYAWGSSLGWINFSGVSISSSGTFTGTASGTIIGTLTFDCANCSVMTDYRAADFRTTTTTTTSSGGGSGSNRGTITESATAPAPAPGLDTPTFPPGAAPTDGGEDGTAEGDGSLLPAQLFDIRLLVDSRNVSRVIDLVARITFESFGRVPTPVALTFTIIDSAGKEVWRSEDTVTVETEQVFVKRFFDVPALTAGNYTLRLHTLYNTVVEDEFEAPFTIAEEGAGWNWVPWFVGGLLLLLFILIFFWWLIGRRRKKEEEERGLNTPYT